MMLPEIVDPRKFAELFTPTSTSGPSGLADAPRPFVFRAAHLNGQTIPPGAEFQFDVHLFDANRGARPLFIHSFTRLAAQGIGPGRGRAALLSVDQDQIAID